MKKVSKILCPTDFSTNSEQALDYALLLAKKFEAELDMLHAVVLHEADPQNPEHRFPAETDLLESLFEVADSGLARQLGQRERGPIPLRQERRRGFSASAVILEYAEEVGADLIVMGTHGHRGPARLFLGSVAESVIRHAACPVLTVRGDGDGDELQGIERILVPVDYSDACAQALEAAREVAQTLDATLQLLHVIDIPTVPVFYGAGSMVDIGERMRQDAMEQMEALSARAGGPAVPFESFVRIGADAPQIAKFAEEHDSGLIVISTHGLGGFERWMLGSTTERVSRLAKCPVLTVKPSDSKSVT